VDRTIIDKEDRLPLSGDAFRGLCRHVFWCNARPEENRAFRHGDTVFCKIDEVWRLFRALRRTRCRIVLVTGEGSKAVTPALWARRPPHVEVWFGTNMAVQHPRALSLPLGLGNAGGVNTPGWREIEAVHKKAIPREKLLYANFGPRTNPAIRGPLWDWVRKPEQAWITVASHTGRDGQRAYLEALAGHRFVLCPPGTGEDTHRFWESLYAGACPVIRETDAMKPFADLPIMMVPDLCGLDANALRARAPMASPSQWPKLWLPYWSDLLREGQDQARSRGRLGMLEFCRGWIKEIFAIARGAATC